MKVPAIESCILHSGELQRLSCSRGAYLGKRFFWLRKTTSMRLHTAERNLNLHFVPLDINFCLIGQTKRILLPFFFF